MPRIHRFDADDLDFVEDLFDDPPPPRHATRDRPPRREPAPTPSPPPDTYADPRLPHGATLSTYPDSTHGPRPTPSWVIADGDAYDFERGVVKTGKEAVVNLVERVALRSGRSVLLAAKRYRSSEHRLFHRDAGYLEGRRVRRSRETRAMATRTEFGQGLIAQQWAATEFAVLGRMWSAGVPVPYPLQLDGTEVLLEFIGDDDGAAAPRLAEVTGDAELVDLWDQCVDALVRMAEAGWTHGDLSACNLLVHDGRVVVIDLPQVVDIVGNPQGFEYLARDCRNLCRWFTSRGLDADADRLVEELVIAAGGPADGRPG